MEKSVRTLIIGDIVGKAGMGALFIGLSTLIKKEKIDFVIANGENTSGGRGITEEEYRQIKDMGVDVITSGNHIWNREDAKTLLTQNQDLLRPANYPSPSFGQGYVVKKKGPFEIAVINLQGRVRMPITDCPFKKSDEILKEVRKRTKLIFVDFHGEDAQEKEAMGFYLDGKVSSVTGTHTHVQTADEKILPAGTAYITDVGMTGFLSGVIGSDPENSVNRQITLVPLSTEPSEKAGNIQGVVVEVEIETGKAVSIKRITE